MGCGCRSPRSEPPFRGARREEGRALLGVIGGGPPPPSSSGQNVAGQPDESPKRDVTWHQEVEGLLTSLNGVISARVVGRPGHGIEEVHLLTTVAVAPKQTVRNVESALLARFDLAIDHRKVSVAQTTADPRQTEAAAAAARPLISARRAAGEPRLRPEPAAPRRPEPEPPPPDPGPAIVRQIEPATAEPEGRILFVGHSVESLRSQRLRMKVALEWQGRRLVGEASGADISRSRLEGFATATLAAVEAALDPTLPESERDHLALTLDGVQIVEAFDRKFVLVAVSALLGNKLNMLTGAAAVEDSRDRAVILATLQATDRRVRAFLQGIESVPANGPGRGAGDQEHGDPFEVWA